MLLSDTQRTVPEIIAFVSSAVMRNDTLRNLTEKLHTGGGGGGEDSPIKMPGVLVGNFEKNP